MTRSSVCHCGTTVMIAIATMMSLCMAAVHATAFSEIDNYYTVVELQAGTQSFNATATYNTTTLDTLSSDICALVLPLLPGANANLSKGCFVSFELTPTVLIHVSAAARGSSSSFPVYSQVTSWSSTFSPLPNIRQRIFTTFGVPAPNTTLISVTPRIPCRSAATRPGATPAPTLPPVVCAANTSIVPVVQDLVLLTQVSIASTTALANAVCDVLGATTCAKVSVVSINQPSADYTPLMASTVRFSATLSTKVTAMLTLTDAVRKGLYPTLNTFQTQRVLMVAPQGTVGNRTAAVTLFHTTEDVNPNSPPSVIECNQFYSYWALILLIIAPILWIVFRQAYHAGRRKGLKLQRQELQEDAEIAERQAQAARQGGEEDQGITDGDDGRTFHRSATSSSANFGHTYNQHNNSYANFGAPSVPVDPNQWDPETIAYVQQMLQMHQQHQQQPPR